MYAGNAEFEVFLCEHLEKIKVDTDVFKGELRSADQPTNHQQQGEVLTQCVRPGVAALAFAQ